MWRASGRPDARPGGQRLTQDPAEACHASRDPSREGPGRPAPSRSCSQSQVARSPKVGHGTRRKGEAADGKMVSAAPQLPQRCGVVLEQGPALPAIERSDRGDPRRRAIDLPAKMIEDLRRYQLDRIERPAGHLEKADLQGERQSVKRPAALPDRGELVLVERKEVLDLELTNTASSALGADFTEQKRGMRIEAVRHLGERAARKRGIREGETAGRNRAEATPASCPRGPGAALANSGSLSNCNGSNSASCGGTRARVSACNGVARYDPPMAGLGTG